MLTDSSVRNSKPKDRPYKLADGHGLHLLVTPGGSRLWRLKYRVAGKEKLLSIGAYPTVSIKAAREARESAREMLATGVDPSQAKKAAKRIEKDTFDAIAAELIEKKKSKTTERTIEKLEWFSRLASSALGARPVAGITRSLSPRLCRGD